MDRCGADVHRWKRSAASKRFFPSDLGPVSLAGMHECGVEPFRMVKADVVVSQNRRG